MAKESGVTTAQLGGSGGTGSDIEVQELALSAHLWRVMGQLRHMEKKTSVPLPPMKLLPKRDCRSAIGVSTAFFGNAPLAVQCSSTPAELAESSLADTAKGVVDAMARLCKKPEGGGPPAIVDELSWLCANRR